MELVTQLMQAMPMPVLLIGPTERVVVANAAADSLLGYSGAGRHYITALRQPVILDSVEQTFRDGQTRASGFLLAEAQREATWHVTVTAVNLDGARNVLLTFEDVTAIEEAGKMRRDFVTNVSHELRTPLTAVLGFVETLSGAARDDAAARQRFLGIIEHEARRMANLVEDLLSLSKVEEDERVRPTDPVEIVGLTRTVLTAQSHTAMQRGISFNLTVSRERQILPGDELQLEQVLTNLVSNAIKYGGADRTIHIDISAPQDEPSLRATGVNISVRDEGEGIPDHHISRLTERFYRMDSHRSRELGGTGLGLAIVKHIVNRHRGRLLIESDVGVGSTFTVSLPIH